MPRNVGRSRYRPKRRVWNAVAGHARVRWTGDWRTLKASTLFAFIEAKPVRHLRCHVSAPCSRTAIGYWALSRMVLPIGFVT